MIFKSNSRVEDQRWCSYTEYSATFHFRTHGRRNLTGEREGAPLYLCVLARATRAEFPAFGVSATAYYEFARSSWTFLDIAGMDLNVKGTGQACFHMSVTFTGAEWLEPGTSTGDRGVPCDADAKVSNISRRRYTKPAVPRRGARLRRSLFLRGLFQNSVRTDGTTWTRGALGRPGARAP